MIVALVDYHNKFNLELPKNGQNSPLLKYLNGEKVELKNFQYGKDGKPVLDAKGNKVVKQTHSLQLKEKPTINDLYDFVRKTNEYNKSEDAKKGVEVRIAKVVKELANQEMLAKKHEINEEANKKDAEILAKGQEDYNEHSEKLQQKYSDLYQEKKEELALKAQEQCEQLKKQLEQKVTPCGAHNGKEVGRECFPVSPHQTHCTIRYECKVSYDCSNIEDQINNEQLFPYLAELEKQLQEENEKLEQVYNDKIEKERQENLKNYQALYDAETARINEVFNQEIF